MLSSLLLFSSCFVILGMAAGSSSLHAEKHFNNFIELYDKQYSNDQEKQARFEIFKENLDKANRMNLERDDAEFGITPFMDMTTEEFVNTYASCLGDFNATGMGCNDISDSQVPDANAPESFDWRDHNAVTRVSNQGRCGGCYAFSASGNIEGVFAIKHKQLLELSKQQIIDCDRNSHGCNGGYMTTAFRTLIQQGGITTNDRYPYRGAQQRCMFSPSTAAVRVTDCYSLNIVSQEKLKQFLFVNGPISIGVRATNFQAYKRGVMPDQYCRSGQINHAVLLVGYGNENGNPYWIVKNSWGTQWGENGYIKLQRGEGAESCGMMNNTFMATSVVM